MISFLHHLGLVLLGAMLTVLTAIAQEIPPPPPLEPLPVDPPSAKVTITTDTKEIVVKKSSRRSRSSSSGKTTYDDITMIHGAPVWIKAGESAREVVVVGSDVQVDGAVNGNLVVVMGNVRLGAESKITHGPIVIGGNLTSDPAAKLGLNPTVLSLGLFGGATNIINPMFIEAGKRWFAEGAMRARPLPPRVPLALLFSAFLVLLFVVIGILFQKPVTASVAMLDQKPGSAFLLGLLACALTLPALLLLVVSVVGIVLLPFAVAALGVLLIVGKVAVYRFAGQTLGTQLGLGVFQNPLLALLTGILLFYVAYAVPVIGAAVWLLVVPLGMGAVVLAGLNRSKAAGAVAANPQGIPAADLPPDLAGAQTVLLPRVGFWLRFVATFLDFVLVGLLTAVLARRPEWFLLAWTVYHLVLWSWKGTTVGGIILGLRIVRADGQRMTVSMAVVRLLGAFFSAAVVGLGFFWAGWTPTCQSWHDKIAGTVIVRYPKATPLV